MGFSATWKCRPPCSEMFILRQNSRELNLVWGSQSVGPFWTQGPVQLHRLCANKASPPTDINSEVDDLIFFFSDPNHMDSVLWNCLFLQSVSFQRSMAHNGLVFLSIPTNSSSYRSKFRDRDITSIVANMYWAFTMWQILCKILYV